MIIRPRGFVMRIVKENRQPGFVDTQRGEFVNNVVVWNQGDLFNSVEPLNVGSATRPETFTFAGNHWYNATRRDQSTPRLPTAEADGKYGVNPRIAADAVMVWSFEWGKWLVNTTDRDLNFPEDERRWLQALPGKGATLQIAGANPLGGHWDLVPIPAAVPVPAHSYVILLSHNN
jgi:hypothetical protein